MLVTNDKIESLLKLTDDSFSFNNSSYYDLLVFFNHDDLHYAIIDQTIETFIALETFRFEKANNEFILKETLAALFDKNKIFQLAYNNIKVATGDSKSTLIPSSLYDGTKQKDYLSFNYIIRDETTIKTDNIAFLDAKNIYGISKEVSSLMNTYFPEANIYHSSTSLIGALLSQNIEGKKVFVHVQPSYIEILVINKAQLLFYNIFKYQTIEDFVYFILYVYEQLELNTENIPLVLLGEIYPESALIEAIYKYVREIYFATVPEELNFSSVFADLEAHIYYNLFSLNLCE